MATYVKTGYCSGVSQVATMRHMETKEIARYLDPRVCDAPATLDLNTVAHLGADIVAPLTLGMRDIPVDEVPGLMIRELRADWNTETQSYETTGLAFAGRAGVPVTGATLRRVPVDKYRHFAVRNWLMVYMGDNEFRPYRLDDLGILRDTARNGADDANLRQVARIYSAGRHISDSPRKLVADTFGISASTATNWINLARLEPPKVKEQDVVS